MAFRTRRWFGGMFALCGLSCTAETVERPYERGDDPPPVMRNAGGAGASGEPGAASGATGGRDADTSSTTGAAAAACNGLVVAYVRDFRESHPDMEKFGRDNHEAYGSEVEKGIVRDMLGADRKPVFNMPTNSTTTAENFWQWYNDVEGVNVGFEVPLQFEEMGPGKWQFKSDAFFPADGKGFDEWSGVDDHGVPHNYHFTLELHTLFRYSAEKHQSFKFTGDDDVFAFINNVLVVDLGGVHETAEATVDLRNDVPGLVPGEVYPLDFFFAERHVTQSNFTIETSLALEMCDIIIK